MEMVKRVKENLDGIKNPDPDPTEDSPSTSNLNSPMDPLVVNNDNDQEIYMDDLPPEMLTLILKCMDTSSLVHVCRLVSKKWNEISSGILQKRSDNQLWFNFYVPNGFCSANNRSLKDFLDCMRDSATSCTIAGFLFSTALEKSEEFFHHEDWLQFLCDFNPSNDQRNQNQNPTNKTKMKCLDLTFGHSDEDDSSSFKLMIEQVKDLLLNKLANLEEFSFDFYPSIPNSEIPLFPATTSTEPIKFLQLKTIHLANFAFSRFPGITKDLLTRAINLKKICLIFDNFILTIDVYNLLCSLGKLELLNNAEIELDENFLSQFKKSAYGNPNPFQGFKLQEIEINHKFMVKNPSLNSNSNSRNWTDATNFLSNVLESSKDTLKSLCMRPCGFLHTSQSNHSLCFPEFKNLTDLELSEFYSRGRNISQWPFFPPGIRSMHVFPAVNSLNLGIKNWTAAFPQDDFIPRLPRLRNLSIQESCITEFAISKLALLCPNLKNLRISKSETDLPQLNLLHVGRSIWTEMKQLESLELDVNLDLPHNNSTALNSCFTGISVENCHHLDEIMEAKKTFERHEISVNIPELEIKLKTKATREHPAILDMQGLRKLTINTYSGGKLLEKKEFSNKLSWISQEYAFKLMPQLKLNDQHRVN